jgi:hypothetical protein
MGNQRKKSKVKGNMKKKIFLSGGSSPQRR